VKKILIAALCLSGASFGFDGHRKGFILGGGGGGSYTSYNQEISGYTSPQENAAGLGTDLYIGYGISDQFLLTYFANTNWFSLTNVYGNDVTIANGNAGLGVFYYFNHELVFSSPYLFGGIGWSGWSTPFEKNSGSMAGMGATGGIGYEFAKHFSMQFNVFFTNPSEEDSGIKVQTNSVGFQVSFIALAY